MAEQPVSKLLTPGPVTVHPAVLEALATQSPLHHRSKAFSSLLCTIEAAFRRIFQVDDCYHVLMLGTSGTGANEAMVSCLKGQKRNTVLVLSNGHFGERLSDICASLGIPSRTLSYAPSQGIDLDEVRNTLHVHEEIGAVLLARHETSLGLLNSLEALSQLCEQHGCLFCVDMVSSVGGEESSFDGKNSPDLAVTVSGKAIGAFPGVAFLLVKKSVAEQLLKNENRQGYYFDLARALKSWNEACELPFTPPTVLFPPLLAALREIEQEGLAAKIQRHRECLGILSNFLEKRGFTRLRVQNASSTTATFCYDQKSISEFETLRREFENQGYSIYQNSRYHAPQHLFQVSTMGFLLPDEIATLVHLLMKIPRPP